jgi:hypothetical protein
MLTRTERAPRGATGMTMTTEKASELRDELEDVREAWREWTEQWAAFGRTLRAGGYNTYRLDAYKVGTGSDEGGGQSMEGWLAEIETDLMGEA